ncbi:hypothetical protein BOX15_Mlig018605g2, partial [Macrostomum lignano]
SEDPLAEEFEMLDSFYSSDQLQKDLPSRCGTFRARVRIPESGLLLCAGENGGQQHRLQFLPRLVLDFQLPSGYPEADGRPSFGLSCSWLSRQQLVAIGNRLVELAAERAAEPVLWFWFEFLERELWDFLQLGDELRLGADWRTEDAILNINSSFSVTQTARSAKEVEQEILAVDADERHREFQRSFHECPVCVSLKPGTSCVMFRHCGHAFCDSCVAAAFRALLEADRPDRLGCLQCSGKEQPPADPSLVRRLLSPEEFAKYEQRLFDAALSTMGKLDTCPRCQATVLVDPSEGRCLAHCQACYHAYCQLCRATYHGTEPCRIRGSSLEQVMETYMNSDGDKRYKMEQRYGLKRLRALEEECRTQDYMKSQQKCPACKAYVEKISGCNKMVCFSCKAYFCWLCSTLLDQFDPYRHFRVSAAAAAGATAMGCAGRLFDGLQTDDE